MQISINIAENIDRYRYPIDDFCRLSIQMDCQIKLSIGLSIDIDCPNLDRLDWIYRLDWIGIPSCTIQIWFQKVTNNAPQITYIVPIFNHKRDLD